jgi:two-component system sensor histidine kinase SenX3
LEAALARLDPSSGLPAEGSAGMDELLASIEAAASECGDRQADAEQLTSRLRAALDLVALGVVICDEHGGEAYRNAKAVSYVSARLGDVLAEQAVTDLLALARGGEYPERMLELFSPVRRNLMIRAFPLRDEDGSIGAVAIVEDVSERRRLEAVRRDFVANVSHELKTPVGALSLLAETLDGEEDPEVVARLSSRVATEAERLGRIIDDLLDLSRIEANEAPQRELVPVYLILGQALESLRALADLHHIKLDVAEPPRHLAVPGDRRDLVSAVANLVDNAVKYSERDSLIQVRVEEGDEHVEIAVADQGIGIPARDLERIFERFYRVDRARSRSTGGTGLGLAIVRHVAANHDGSVRVDSKEGEGTTFTLRLPAQPVGTEGPNDG